MSSAVNRNIEAKERAATWRAAKPEDCLCPKHGTPLTPLSRWFVCGPDELLPSPETGDKIKECYRCQGCGKCYHEVSIYHPISDRKLRGIRPGPKNSLFNFDERKPSDREKALSLCGECRMEDGCDDWTKGRYRNWLTWPGLCRRHEAMERRLNKDEHIGEKGRGI